MAASVEELGDLHERLTRRLINWADSDECTPPMAAVITTFLKNNGIVASTGKSTELDALRALLNKPKVQAGVELTSDERMMLGML